MIKALKRIVLVVLVSILAVGIIQLRDLKVENIRLTNNQNQLLSEYAQVVDANNSYRVADSLNGIKTNELLLTISEYERYRRVDSELIFSLITKNANLEKVISSQAATINSLSMQVVDSIVIDTITLEIDTLKCFDYQSKWIDVAGCLNMQEDSMDIHIENRESIKVVETVKYKRFMGFLWKTNRVESKSIDLISENPNTTIVNSEFISIIQ